MSYNHTGRGLPPTTITDIKRLEKMTPTCALTEIDTQSSFCKSLTRQARAARQEAIEIRNLQQRTETTLERAKEEAALAVAQALHRRPCQSQGRRVRTLCGRVSNKRSRSSRLRWECHPRPPSPSQPSTCWAICSAIPGGAVGGNRTGTLHMVRPRKEQGWTYLDAYKNGKRMKVEAKLRQLDRPVKALSSDIFFCFRPWCVARHPAVGPSRRSHPGRVWRRRPRFCSFPARWRCNRRGSRARMSRTPCRGAAETQACPPNDPPTHTHNESCRTCPEAEFEGSEGGGKSKV